MPREIPDDHSQRINQWLTDNQQKLRAASKAHNIFVFSSGRYEPLLGKDRSYMHIRPKPMLYFDTVTPIYYVGYLWELLPGISLAIYEDAILWLDDSENHDDFADFLKRENLVANLSSAPELLARAIVDTKLGGLIKPYVISDVSKIPRYTSDTELSSWEAYQRTKEQESIEFLQAKIVPPQLSQLDGVNKLEFWIWMKFWGTVIQVFCEFGDAFQYKLEVVTSSVGKLIAPKF